MRAGQGHQRWGKGHGGILDRDLDVAGSDLGAVVLVRIGNFTRSFEPSDMVRYFQIGWKT